jgi:uncharacterized protein (DUF1499 family)
VGDGRLAACPASPNCVSSEAERPSQRVEPLKLAVPAEQAWPAVRQAVASLPRTRLVTQDAHHLHAECSSAVFGFVDDLELVLRAEQGVVALRSASRVGYSDMGVNRRRVEKLREALRRQGIVR